MEDHLHTAVRHGAVYEIFAGNHVTFQHPEEPHVWCEIRGRIKDLIKHVSSPSSPTEQAEQLPPW